MLLGIALPEPPKPKYKSKPDGYWTRHAWLMAGVTVSCFVLCPVHFWLATRENVWLQLLATPIAPYIFGSIWWLGRGGKWR